MKNILFYASVCVLFFSTGTTANAQTESEMKAWQAYMAPGEMHKLLASCEGEWTTEGKMWMDPNSQPATFAGQCTYTMTLGGRYQESTFKGDMMGMPFEGKGVMAYDNFKKKFEGSWTDNMGTGIMATEGDYDAGTKTFTMSGEIIDPMSGKQCKVRETLRLVDNDTQVMTMYNTIAGGAEVKAMEMTFKRKK